MKYLTDQQRKVLYEEITQQMEEWIGACCPEVEPPYADVASGEEDGIYVSMSEGEDIAGVVPWEDFKEGIVSNDLDLLERYLPLFKKLVEKMESRIEQQ